LRIFCPSRGRSLLSCAILRIVCPSASFALVDFGFVCGVVAAIGCPLPLSSLGTQRVFFSFRLVRKRHGFFRRPCGHLYFLFSLIRIGSKPQLKRVSVILMHQPRGTLGAIPPPLARGSDGMTAVPGAVGDRNTIRIYRLYT